MVIANFQVEDKANRPRFFKEIFLMTNTKFEVILEMPFFKFSNADVLFGEKTLTLRTYTTNKALSSIKQVQIIDLKESVIAALDINNEIFMMYMAIREQKKMPV